LLQPIKGAAIADSGADNPVSRGYRAAHVRHLAVVVFVAATDTTVSVGGGADLGERHEQVHADADR